MKSKHFYSNLVTLDDLMSELDLLSVSGKEKTDLADIAHVNLHQAIIDTVLSELSESDKKRFLELMSQGEDEKIWDHLHSKVEKIEDKITDAADQLKKELKEDIKKVKA
jgi:hypothetical protein